MNTQQKLDAIAEYESQRDSLNAAKADAIEKALPAEIRAILGEIDVEFSAKFQAVDDNIATLTAEVKAEVLAAGNTVKGAHYMAVWNKGRVSWDGKKLDGMMSIIPALKDARKEGEPSVTLRKV